MKRNILINNNFKVKKIKKNKYSNLTINTNVPYQDNNLKPINTKSPVCFVKKHIDSKYSIDFFKKSSFKNNYDVKIDWNKTIENTKKVNKVNCLKRCCDII